VIQNLLEIGSVDNIEPWLKKALPKRKRSWIGHRVYHTEDLARPSAKMFTSIGRAHRREKWLDVAQMEEIMDAR